MKALSVKQPWASLIIDGYLEVGARQKLKTIETRTWSTKYRGPLLICASRRIDTKGTLHFRKAMREMPLGRAIGIANLVDCRAMRLADEKPACCRLYTGAFSWVLKDIRKIHPFPVKGQLRLFDVFGICRICGCTEDRACEGGCSWANAEKDLCSKCT